MRRLFLLIALLLSLTMVANDKLSAPTQMFLHDYSTGTLQHDGKSLFAKVNKVNGTEAIDCFITLNGTSTAQIEALGVTITGRFDDLVTAQVPIDKIEKVFGGFNGPRYHVAGNHDFDCLTPVNKHAT